MKIKGIDLYKRVLEEDKTILGKTFEFDDMKIKVVNTFGNLSNEWGLMESSSKYGNHIFYNSSKKQIDEIFKAEWVEVRQAVSFMEAVESGRKLKVEHESIGGGEYFKKFDFLDDLIYELADIFSSNEIRQIILNGKWYVED